MSMHRLTIAEYVRLEEKSLEKHEFHDGEMLLMAGGSIDHSLISANVIGELRNRSKGKPCQVFDNNLRIRVPRKVLYTYPDASVICSPRETDPEDPSGQTVMNSRLIVEVLSSSTEGYDRGEKFNYYREIDSLTEYVLVSQSTPRVETFLRQADGGWLFNPTSGFDASAKLRSLAIDMPLSEVYRGVEFDRDVT